MVELIRLEVLKIFQISSQRINMAVGVFFAGCALAWLVRSLGLNDASVHILYFLKPLRSKLRNFLALERTTVFWQTLPVLT